ncbi:MAG: ATP-binding protein [Planctomycetes bacterium]|nr:ATP-binding protein [Planctomycetota bacterium]
MAKAPEPDPLEAARALAIQLNLTTIARELSAILARAESTSPSFSEFLRQALEIEQAARRERKIQRRLRWSRIGATIPLSDFDFAVRPQLSPAVVRELATCRYIEERRNVILVGRPSTGKTSIAKILGRAACERGLSVYYTPMAEMLAALHAARADGTYRKVFRRVGQSSLLVIDDAGFGELDPQNANELFKVVRERHRQRSTILVSNLPFKQWAELLPSPGLAVAIVDRLLDDATVLRFSGKPFRQPRDIHGEPLDGE